MTDNLRDRIAAVQRDRLLNEIDGAVNGVDNIYVGDYVEESAIHLTPLADAVIAALPELKRQDKIRTLCDTILTMEQGLHSNRAWLAHTVLNVLNGAVDE